MACGNNHVGRDDLSSGPKDVSAVTDELFAAPPAVTQFPRAPESKRWGGRDQNMFYSRSKSDIVDYFIGPDGNPTFAPDRHIHVIHNEAAKEVTLVLTDRTQTEKKDQHGVPVILPGNPSGNQGNNAIAALVRELNDRPMGPETVTWP
jgi:hypothetical protein